MVIGAITGWLGSRIMQSGTGGVIKDSVLGSLGYLGGFFACAPTRYEHPERVAVVVAILLPVLHEWYRSRRKRAVTDLTS
jgi:uncharacterized membrane protein YeaQ/YmgE (transglycosylase-associated protein family)